MAKDLTVQDNPVTVLSQPAKTQKAASGKSDKVTGKAV
jgi:hypothetical protein